MDGGSPEGWLAPAGPWTVAVLGPGGVGGLLAALLSRAGHRVVCLAGERTAEELRQRGIRVRSAQFGEFTAPVEADTELREPVDLCVVAVKQPALDAALGRVPSALLDGGLVLPLLNGVEHPTALRARFGERVVPAAIRVESTRQAPGEIDHGSPFTELDVVGAGDAGRALAELFEAVGVRCRVTEDETATLWAKLAFLAPLALLTTRYAVPVGEVRTARRPELAALVAEAAAVSAAVGAPVDPALVLDRYDAFPAAARSSMQRDAEAGRPLELDAVGGAVLRAAARHGVSVPVTRRLVAELRESAR
ncbi:ketopantoate reductase family protein [Streptomyces sp. JJ38]|uniref:ketopantoate reductase family protein n=1 Tax=Streptomyces sp. JJ38 TaxID=2738128 RepID=UPI001C58B31B|nr:2-dehydropantoate 2-reductase [Streptomyces sp. JJ38]MBW1598341.1 ketopantoate reductase family protein [Streptomyces sp. JJ38]